MTGYYKKAFNELEEQINELLFEQDNLLASYQKVIEILLEKTALHTRSVFDNGNADIKIIAKTFERAFNIDLGDFYHMFMELKARKINCTKFLDSLCEALI